MRILAIAFAFLVVATSAHAACTLNTPCTISNMPAASAISGSDKFAVFQGSDDGSATTATALATFFGGAPASSNAVIVASPMTNKSATTVIDATSKSIECLSPTFNLDAGAFGFHGNFRNPNACGYTPTAILTNGLIEFAASERIAGEVANFYSFGLSESDGSKGMYFHSGTVGSHVSKTTLSGYQYWAYIDAFAEALYITDSIGAATGWGIFIASGTNIEEAVWRGNNLSDMDQAGLFDLGGLNAFSWLISDNYFLRDAVSLGGFTGSQSGTTLTVASMVSATFTGNSSGTALTASSITGNIPFAGPLGGNACIPANTHIVEYDTGTHVITTDNATTCSAQSGLTATSIAYLAAGHNISVPGGSPATEQVVAQTGGTPGGAGTYTVSASQTVASNTKMTFPGSAVYATTPFLNFTNNEIALAGTAWPFSSTVAADGIILTASTVGGLVSGGLIHGNVGDGIRVTGQSYVITDTYLTGNAGKDIHLDTTSNNNYVSIFMPITLQDDGSGNYYSYLNAANSGKWTIKVPGLVMNGSTAVSCPSGITAVTVTVVDGIVTHC